MPNKAPTTCKRSGCPGLVRDGVCSACGPLRAQRQADHDARRGTAADRGYDRRWQRIRVRYLRQHPLCVACGSRGIVTPATDVDHIVAKRRGGPDNESNLQALCHSCHSAKTARGE
jgi:5-methylcytosine-specific restriction enzyme A